MKKLTALSLAAFFAASAFVGCNSDYEPAQLTSTSVAVKSFSLSKDDSVLAYLDTVFFSINLEQGKIFNADSLPYGTDISKLVPKISFLETVSAANLIVKRADGTDTVYNYLTNSTDSIDFSNGPVKLTVVSPSGTASLDYEIIVNVHKLVSDSLMWAQTAYAKLPTTVPGSFNQHTVRAADGLYTLTVSGSSAAIAHAATPSGPWEIYTPALPAGADYKSLRAGNETLYILAGGKIFKSTDGGRTWSTTGVAATHLYGCYEDRAIGVNRSGSTYSIVEYPAASASKTFPEGMPVSGTSEPLTVKYPLASNPQIIMVGGTRADGTLCNSTWAFDGTSWAEISSTNLPAGLTGLSVVPFFSFTINTAYIATEHSVLLAFGGNDGKANSATTYISFDFGMTWNEGSSLIQLPDYIAPFSDAQAYVFDSELTPSRSLVWKTVGASRATTPVESWDCPYIYIFGGVDSKGNTSDKIWRGTLNRLTFKPIQ